MRSDFRAGMNVDASTAVGPLRHDARDERQVLQIKLVRHALDGDGLERGIGQDDFFVAFRRGIALVCRIDIGPKHLSQCRQLRKKSRQQLVGAFFYGGVWRIFAKAFAEHRLQSRVQIPQSASGHLRQIARIHQGFAAKTGEHQAHQLGAGVVNGRARGQHGSGGEIINAAIFGVGVKQLFGSVAPGRFH